MVNNDNQGTGNRAGAVSTKQRKRRTDALRGARKSAILTSLRAGKKSAVAVAAKYQVSPRAVRRAALAAPKPVRYLAGTRTTPLSAEDKRNRLRFARLHLRQNTDWGEW